MNLTLPAAMAGVALVLTAAQPAHAQAPTAAGVWRQVDDRTGAVRSLITIAETGGVFGGVISKVFPREGEVARPLCDACTGALKDRPIIGLPLLSNLRREGLTYTGGTIVDPENGKRYDVRMTLSPDGGTLEVRGYIGVALLGRSQTWQREK